MPPTLLHMTHPWNQYPRIIVFDGVCNFCNGFVNFVVNRDPTGLFKLATLQSPPAQQLLRDLQLPTEDFETFLYLEHGIIHTKSTAGLKILRELGLPWSVLYSFIIIPSRLRDLVYIFMARHRYQWMGKSDRCRLPTQEDRDRFV